MTSLNSVQLDILRRTPTGRCGNRLAKAIELSGETQTSVGKAIGLPHTYVSDVARGRHSTITLSNAYKFADAFGCQIEELFPRSGGEQLSLHVEQGSESEPEVLRQSGGENRGEGAAR